MKTIIIIFFSLWALISCGSTEVKKNENTETENIEVTLEDEIPDGDFIQKFPSGAIQIKGLMLNNKREGLWTAYYENGVKQSESTYQSGVLHGRTASFYTNGQVRYIGYFLGGKKDGKWQFYLEDGELDKNELFVKGNLSTK